jgi:hypothetical protein
MYKASLNYAKSPFILEIFEREILSKLDKNYLKNLEKKLLKVYDDDIIPPDFKKKVKF